MDNPAPIQTQGAAQRSRRFLWAASVLLVVLVAAAAGTYVWYFLYKPCEVSAVEEASAFLISQRKSYDKAYQFAVTASRTALVRPLAVLQRIHMDTQQVIVPACMQTAKHELVSYMEAVNRAFLAFGAAEPDTTIRDLIDQSEAHYDHFTAELEAVKECAPFCFP